MNKILKVLKNNQDKFDEKFPATHNIYPSKKAGYLTISEASVSTDDLKSHLLNSQIELLRAVIEMMEGRKIKEMTDMKKPFPHKASMAQVNTYNECLQDQINTIKGVVKEYEKPK